MSNGLKNNYVHTINKDEKQRTWIGTDNGLMILNYKDLFLQNIIETFHTKPIWSIEFYKNYAIVGTRYSGIYIYNLTEKKLSKYFDTSQINFCRRIRVFNDTILIATNNGAYNLLLKENKWHLNLFKTKVKNDFFTDFVKWKNQLFAVLYTSDAKPENVNSHALLFKIEKDSLLDYKDLKILPKFNTRDFSFLSAASNDSLLVLGGGASYFITDQAGNQQYKLLKSSVNNKLYPIWDIAFADKRPFMVTGNPENNRMGMLYEPGVSSLSDLNNFFYGQSLYYDSINSGMWIGTLNKGLFYWPFISTSYQIPFKTNRELQYKPISATKGLLFNEFKVIEADLETQSFEEIFTLQISSNDRNITDVLRWADSTAILTNSKLVVLKGKKRVLEIYETGGDKLCKINQSLYLFTHFTDEVRCVNLKTKMVNNIYAPSYQIKGIPYNNNLLYASVNTGFHYFDSVAHSFNIAIPVVESFTVLNDTLWVLNAGTIKSYKIRLQDFSLTLINVYNFNGVIPNFIPKWIAQTKGNLYCGNEKGFLKISTKTIKPSVYTYLGNFKEGDPPITLEDNLLFNQENYISVINPSGSENIDSSLLNLDFSIKNQIYQFVPFKVQFNYPDYLLQRHSLKTIEVFRNNKRVKTIYSIDDYIDFPSGLEKGNYKMVFLINNKIVEQREVDIAVPLLSNPWFYGFIFFFLLAFILLIFRSILVKRTYDRRILENRLQLLKQNLNPHFIFNSLNLIYSLVLQNKNKAAIKTINNFSDLHRYYLENINKPLVSLEEELMFIESYLKLESERVELDNPFKFKLPESLTLNGKEKLVPPMILQPLVENAVKFCSADLQSKEEASIWIDITFINDHLIIGIENTMDFSKDLRPGTGLGKSLVLERIEIYNKRNRENISLHNNAETLHCRNGYRCEIRF